MAASGPKNGPQGLERGPTLVFGRLCQLLLIIKFFDPSTPSIRKGCAIEEEKKWGPTAMPTAHAKRGKKREKNGEKNSPLLLLAVNRLNGDRLQRQHSCQLLR